MRIGITGPSGAGKSTLAAALAAYYGLAVAFEGAREAAEALGLIHSAEVDATNGLAFQHLVLENKMNAEAALWPRYVSDRTVIDCAAFWLYRQLRGFLPSSNTDREEYFQTIDRYIRRTAYHVIIFLEPGAVAWVDDGFRISDDEPMHALILGTLHGRFRQALAASRTKLLVVPKDFGTVESRVKFSAHAIATCGISDR